MAFRPAWDWRAAESRAKDGFELQVKPPQRALPSPRARLPRRPGLQLLLEQRRQLWTDSVSAWEWVTDAF